MSNIFFNHHGSKPDFLSQAHESVRQDFFASLKALTDDRVIYYARYIINAQGAANIITNNADLYNLHLNGGGYKDLGRYIAQESLFAKQNNLAYIIRSDKKISSDDPFEIMSSMGLNNGLAKYHFLNHGVELSCFWGGPDDLNACDFFINKIFMLEQRERKILAPFLAVKNVAAANNVSSLLIPTNIMQSLLTNIYNCASSNSHVAENLSYHEAVYLALLLFECSNEYIARKLNISESKVKKDLRSLREKLTLTSRDELISFASGNNLIKELARRLIVDLF
jgi:DNA-binding CsgD family transcriptional regulator